MSIQSPFRKILLVGEDEHLTKWFRLAIQESKLPWRVRTIEPLRMGSPDSDLLSHDLVVIQWVPREPQTLSEVLRRTHPVTRSPEGLLHDLEAFGGERFRNKTVVLSSSLRREDTVLLAEHDIRHIVSLPNKHTKWQEAGEGVMRRLQRILRDIAELETNPEEKESAKFLDLLKSWDRLSDEVRMEATDVLLSVLGDSARYAEMMARKSLKEGDKAAAERWLLRAINKNPNYLQAMRLLAQVYMQNKRFSDAMALFQKLHINSPRNLGRMSDMGECLIALGEYERAERVFEDALKIDEFHIDARDGLGKVKCVLGQYEEARALLASSSNQKDLAVFLNILGVQLVDQKQFEKAINHYKKAQFVLPSNEQSHLVFFNIALAYLKWGKVVQALSYAKLAITRDPRYDKAGKLIAHIEQSARSQTSGAPIG
jgi:tetratricopeptide (TPR) repeat protein